MNRSHLSKLVAFIVGCLCIYAAYQYNQSSLYQVSGSIYGTSYNITSSKYINDQLNLQIKNELNRIDLIASNYKKASELSALNEHILSDPFTLSNDLKIILNKAIEINQLSPKYDITIGNKINQLGFGPATNVLKNIRTEYKPMQTKFSLSGNQLIKNENFLFDLSSIAKGYAVDQISKILDKNNHNNYLIDIGGELIVRGSKLGNSWVVGVQNPSSLINDAIFTIEHNDESHLSVATSGEYRNYYISNDEVISHTIDPVSGQSVQSESLSVTVKGNISCMEADAYATLFNLLEPYDGIALADSMDLAITYLMNDGTRLNSKKW